MTTKRSLLLAQLLLLATLLGCATEPPYSPLVASEIGPLTERPARSPKSITTIMEPGDNIRIRGLNKGRFVCSNGKPLICDQIGLTAYCSCPGSWERR